MRHRVVAGGAVVLVLALAGVGAAQPDRSRLVAKGQTVFGDQGCYGCHTVGAVGTPIAPDLARIGLKYSEHALARWLRDPTEQKPTAHMPKIRLAEAEVEALAAFLASLR